MSVTDLIVHFVGGRQSELAGRAEELRSELHEVAHGALHADTADETRRRIEELDLARVQELPDLVGQGQRDRARELARRIERCLGRVAAKPTERAVDELGACARELADLQTAVRRSVRRTQTGIALALALVAAGTYVVQVALRLEQGLEPLSSDIVWPPSLYESVRDENTTRFSIEDRDTFLAEFADGYFDGDGRIPPFGLPATFRDEGEAEDRDAAHVVWKAVSRNRSGDDALFVSRIEVVTTCVERTTFPWKELDVTPTLAVDMDRRPVRVSVTGNRPARNARCSGETESGVALVPSEVDWILPDRPMRYSLRLEDMLWCDVDDDDRLELPLFYVHEEPPTAIVESGLDPWELREEAMEAAWADSGEESAEGPSGVAVDGARGVVDQRIQVLGLDRHGYLRIRSDGTEFRTFGDPWFEVVDTVARLAEITTTRRGEEFTVTCEAEALDGAPVGVVGRGRFDGGRMYYAQLDELWDYLPADEAQNGDRESGLDSAGHYDVLTVLGALNPRLRRTQSEGEQLLSFSLGMNLGSLDEGDGDRRLLTPDAFLAPRGILALTCRFDTPGTGTYRVEVWINGERAESLQLETLVPEVTAFDPEHAPGWGVVHPARRDDPWGPPPVLVRDP
jgi:hypothetical protein